MTEHTRDELERARAKWWATVSSGDLDGYVSLFADDAVWVTPELDEIVGRDAIRAWLAPVFAQFDYELTITVADVRIAGDLGIERARFVSRMTPKPVVPAAPLRPVMPDVPVAPAPLPARQWVPGDVEGVEPVADSSPMEPGAAPEGAVEPVAPAWGADPAAGAADPAEEPAGEEPSGGEPSTEAAHLDAPAIEPETELEIEVEDESEPEVEDDDGDEDVEPVEAPLLAAGADAGDHEPHEGRYLMYWRWHEGVGWLVHRYADVTGVG